MIISIYQEHHFCTRPKSIALTTLHDYYNSKIFKNIIAHTYTLKVVICWSAVELRQKYNNLYIVN